eukprot:2303188-Pleurochrysis_carterae.AAC.1
MTVSAVSSMWKFSHRGVVAFSGCPRGRVRTGRPSTGGAYLPSLTKAYACVRRACAYATNLW